jgi:hypothetical protein
MCLHHQGVVAEQLEDYAGSRSLYAESLILSGELGDRWGLVVALDGLAGLAGSRDQQRRGARLWGAANALREANGMPRPPREQAEYQTTLVVLGAALDEDACAAALREGRALTLDQAVALALAPDQAG